MYQHILKVAERLFYEEGIRAVGVDRVIVEAKVAKATLYRHFPSKDHLVEAYLRARHGLIIASLKPELENHSNDPKARLLKLFEIIEQKSSSRQFRGCAFLIAVTEYGTSERVVAIAREHKSAIRQIVADIASQLVEDASALTDEILICYEGALATISVSRTSDAAVAGRRCAEILVDAAVAKATTLSSI